MCSWRRILDFLPAQSEEMYVFGFQKELESLWGAQAPAHRNSKRALRFHCVHVYLPGGLWSMKKHEKTCILLGKIAFSQKKRLFYLVFEHTGCLVCR